jgi:hypothetical protein
MRASLFVAATLTLASATLAQEKPVEDLNVYGGPPMLGIHWARGEKPAAFDRAASSSPLEVYHGGKVLTTVHTFAIFRGSSWATYTGDKITGMDSWYAGFVGSNYAATVDEWTQASGAHANSTPGSHVGHYVDTRSETSHGGRTSTVAAEVCSALANAGVTIDPNGNGYYPLYSDRPRGGRGFCAYHSATTCNGIPIQFAFFFNLDGDPGCDPQSTVSGESQGLAALANVSGHELAESMSDPATPGAWYDSSGQENGDKCAWTFGAPFVTFSNQSQWKIQGEWSNNAYNAGTGYPNSSGQKGCLTGN